MIVLGIDPGVTTGIALYSATTSEVLHADDITSPLHLYKLLDCFRSRIVAGDAVVIEQFVGAGPRTPEAVETLKLVGFVEFLCQSWGVPVTLHTPQKRKPYLAAAHALLPKGPHHATDALGHALAFLGLNPIMPEKRECSMPSMRG